MIFWCEFLTALYVVYILTPCLVYAGRVPSAAPNAAPPFLVLIVFGVRGFLISCASLRQFLALFPVLLESLFGKFLAVCISWRILPVFPWQFQYFRPYIKVFDPLWINFCSGWEIPTWLYSAEESNFPSICEEAIFALISDFFFLNQKLGGCLHVGFLLHSADLCVFWVCQCHAAFAAVWGHVRSGTVLPPALSFSSGLL